MKYRTTDPLQKAKFLARASYLAEKGRGVELKELRPFAKRTISQNNCFWAWCSLIAEIIGEHSVEAVARDIKREILGQREVVNVFTGEVTREDYQTHLMSDEEMSGFLDKMKQWAFSTYGWSLPSREDEAFEEMIEEYGK